jgi:transposase InsO family protein
VKYAFIERERTHFPLDRLCRVLEVSRSGYYAHQARQTKPAPDTALRAALRDCHAASRGTYGRPRLLRDLHEAGYRIGAKRLRRLMREAGVRGKTKGRWRPQTTDSRHTRPLAENLLERRFEVTSPVSAWVSDITYVETREGWLYLAVVLSIQTRQVLGYSLAARMTDELVLQAFLNARTRYPTGHGVLFHSDRGSQYASHRFRRTLGQWGFVASMSRKGNCWDNAVAESFFATLKNEEASRAYATRADAHAGITGYIHGFYNPVRRHSALGYLSPDTYARTLHEKRAS